MLKGKLGGLLKKGVAAAGVPLKQEQELQHQGLQWRAAVQAAKTKKEELLAEAASAPDGISKLLVHMRRNVDPAERAELVDESQPWLSMLFSIACYTSMRASPRASAQHEERTHWRMSSSCLSALRATMEPMVRRCSGRS